MKEIIKEKKKKKCNCYFFYNKLENEVIFGGFQSPNSSPKIIIILYLV
jgi:hypothetical protein